MREAEALHDHVDTQDVPVAPSRGDKYGCDPDRFKYPTGRKPRGFHKAVGIASVVIIDEMRIAQWLTKMLLLFCFDSATVCRRAL